MTRCSNLWLNDLMALALMVLQEHTVSVRTWQRAADTTDDQRLTPPAGIGSRAGRSMCCDTMESHAARGEVETESKPKKELGVEIAQASKRRPVERLVRKIRRDPQSVINKKIQPLPAADKLDGSIVAEATAQSWQQMTAHRQREAIIDGFRFNEICSGTHLPGQHHQIVLIQNLQICVLLHPDPQRINPALTDQGGIIRTPGLGIGSNHAKGLGAIT